MTIAVVQKVDSFPPSQSYRMKVIRIEWKWCFWKSNIELYIVLTDKASSIRRSDQCFVWRIFGWWLSCPWICSVFRSEGLPSYQRGKVSFGVPSYQKTCWTFISELFIVRNFFLHIKMGMKLRITFLSESSLGRDYLRCGVEGYLSKSCWERMPLYHRGVEFKIIIISKDLDLVAAFLSKSCCPHLKERGVRDYLHAKSMWS